MKRANTIQAGAVELSNFLKTGWMCCLAFQHRDIGRGYINTLGLCRNNEHAPEVKLPGDRVACVITVYGNIAEISKKPT